MQAILNRTPATVVPATGNWWGHSSGPQDPVGNPGGLGDPVSTGVNYGGHLTAVPLLDPTIRLAAPAPYYEQSRISLELSCVNAVEYRIAEGGNFSGVAFRPLPNGRATVEFDLSEGDGRKALGVEFRAAGGALATASLQGGVLVDTQSPTVSVNNPAPGSHVNAPITIEATAADVSGVQHVEFYLGAELLGIDTDAPYTHDWDPSVVADGDYVVRAVATDGADRVGERAVPITVAHGAPLPDTEGPQLTDVEVDGLPLVDGATFTRSASLTFTATDRSAISRIELLLDGAVVATATENTHYSVVFDLTGVANGDHSLALRAMDSLANESTLAYAITVAHAAPPAPVLTQPTEGLVTRNPNLPVSGTAQPGSSVQIILNDEPVADPMTVAADGRFSTVIILSPGSNALQAVSTDLHGSSPLSDAVSVTLDSTVPSAPGNLAAAVAAGGRIRLNWSASSDPNVVAHDIYRATREFAAIGEAQLLLRLSASAATHEDAPAGDGTYHYRVVAVNAVDTPSAPTNLASATIDRSGPFAERIEYTARGAYDAGTGTFGRGPMDIKVTVSEPLSGTPYFSLVPEGGLPIPVDLIKRSDTLYEGVLTLGVSAGTGMANVLFSARDLVGNRGVEVREGASLRIDTLGPEVVQIALSPQAPINVDASRQVTATFGFSEALPAGNSPQLHYQLSGTGRQPIVIGDPQRIDGTTWQVQFELPADAGQAAAELLSFGSTAEDALGNVSNRIAAPNEFQVYQGELPALNVPLGLAATALPDGQVRLEWQAVDGASGYQIYRQAPADAELGELVRSSQAQAVDSTPVDGSYRYAVAAVRTSNGQESVSGQSTVVEVSTSRTAPGAPQNLELSLTPQGVLATWQPPLGPAPASYRLYRAATSAITSVDGLTPIKQGIRTTQAVDAVPSQDEHAYAVTALDAAGNESAISNSVYLNFSLLPVKHLQVEQIDTGLPVLSWEPNGAGAVGYDVYVGEGEERFKLTPEPASATTLTDTGFTGGERRYTVETVDANDVRMPRGIVLPNATMQIVGGLPLKRNVMNRVNVQVSNLSSDTLTAARLVATLASREFSTEAFVLDGNATRLVPLVIGGHPDLPSPATLDLVLENIASEGELMRMGRRQQVDVVDSALVVGLDAENFTRGATGRVRLTVENTSEVEVELLTARNFGRDASNELRLKLLDGDGNLLSTTPYLQATGSGVITVASGQTVARIAPGQRYVSGTFLMPVPASAPDRVRLKLEVDKLRHNTGEPEEVAIPGMGSERVVDLVETPYYGEVTSVDPVVSHGTGDIVIQGRALDRASEAAVPNAPLKIAFSQEGFERLADVVTDPDGAFRYILKPTITDSGLYRVGAIHPDMTDRPEQASFTINRVNISPSSFRMTAPRNYAYRIDFRAKTGTGARASNLRVVYAPEFQPSGVLPQGISVTLPAPLDIAPRQDLSLPVGIAGDNTAAPSGRLVLAVISDGSGATPLALLPVDYTLTEAVPALYATPNYVEAGLAQGQSVIEKVEFENRGFVAMTDVVLELLNNDGGAAPGWISLASSSTLGNIGVGETRTADLSIAPPESVAEGIHEFKLRVSGANLPAEDVNIFVSITQSGQGNVLFKASDIYTATRDAEGNLIPGLAGARVYVQNEAVISQFYELTTDAYGEAYFQDLPAGSYRYRASAPNHQEAGGRFSIKPGLTVNQSVFLEYTLVTVEWSVREITIEDRYEIILNATFETDVPAPVVMLQPTSINLPKMAAGEVFQGELVLTNYGLVRADDVTATLPGDDSYFKYEFLAQPPNSLEAKQRVRLPYRIVALQNFGSDQGASASAEPVTEMSLSAMASQAAASSGSNVLMTPTAETASASGTPGCYTYNARYRIRCRHICANGVWSSNCGSGANWFYTESWGCPSGGSPIGGGSGGVGGGNGGPGGSGGPDYSPMPGIPLCVQGSGDCFEPDNKQSGGGNEGGQ
ncbi:Ig-like domain-containing protein [Luteimonas salinisoli]|uniref:Ig-like domain-containing protein n=1 Tax=Luteimonas salinisoli TaxID=2752307 RepID=UPI00214DBED6|nr:Ig-like domain-containing protein [Luteimonas salinisoli]